MPKAASKPHGGPFKPGDKRINRTIPGPGRPPDKFREEMRSLASWGAKTVRIKQVMADENHPLFAFAWKHATEQGYGRPAQSLDVTSGGEPLKQSVVVFGGLTVEF